MRPVVARRVNHNTWYQGTGSDSQSVCAFLQLPAWLHGFRCSTDHGVRVRAHARACVRACLRACLCACLPVVVVGTLVGW